MRYGGSVLFLASALVLAGCGNPPPLVSVPRVTVTSRTLRTLPPGQAATPTTSAASTGTPSQVPVGVPTTAAPEGTATGEPRAGTAFCTQVRRYTNIVNQLDASPSGTQLHQLVIDVTTAMEAAATTAPPQVKGDVVVMAEAHRRFLTALEQAGFDPAALAPGAAGELQSASYLAAKERVRVYNRQNC